MIQARCPGYEEAVTLVKETNCSVLGDGWTLAQSTSSVSLSVLIWQIHSSFSF